MRGTVLSDQTCPVKTEDHRESLYRHVMYDVVKGSLHERGIDSHIGLHTLLGKTSGKCHGMAFGNAYIKGSFRKNLLKPVHRSS